MDVTSGGRAVDWLHWGGDAFRRARAERKPILLSIVTSWALGCREMDRLCYEDPTIVALIDSRLIPIRIDADDRPDLADRYDLGGLPTTAFLNENGELLGGGTFVPPDRLRAAIEKVATGGVRPGHVQDVKFAREETPLDNYSDDALAEVVFSTFDDAHGGFGGAPKFPLTAPVRLAIDIYTRTHTPEMLHRAVLTLDAMGWGALYDAEDGGFFRCAAGEDWTPPAPEKLLVTNAALLDLYLHATERLGHERWSTRAADVIEYLNRALVASGGGWRVSESSSSKRRLTDANALAVSALLRAAALFKDDDIGRRAIDALERVLLASYKPGLGVAHAAGGVRGLLGDQVTMAAANLDAWEAIGNIVYKMMAEELMHYALRTMWDSETGGFFDRQVGSQPDEPCLGALKPFVLNCEAAIVLERIARATEDPMFAQRSRQTLAAMHARAAAAGPLAAHYLIAKDAVLR